MPFQKGQSGNPGGRPKDEARIRDLARKHSKAAIKRLVDWMESDNPKASVAAAQALLDRGFGKPQQAIEVSGEITHQQMSDSELDRRIQQLIAQAGIAAALGGESATSEPAQTPHLLS